MFCLRNMWGQPPRLSGRAKHTPFSHYLSAQRESSSDDVPRSGGRICPPREVEASGPGRMPPGVGDSSPPVEFPHALPSNSGVAGLRYLFNHPTFLADGSSAGASLAGQRGFALPRSRSRLDRHVGWHGRADRPVAGRNVLFDALDLGSIRSVICDRHLSVFQRRSTLQLGAIGRPARSSRRSPGRSARNHRHSLAGAPSCLPRPSLRDAGVECRNRPGRLLGPDRRGGRNRRRDDSHGGRRTGEALR
jgi:hypothetical protein